MGDSGLDIRICFLGESFVNGTGDSSHLGWTGPVCADLAQRGYAITYYNLGIRRETSRQLLTWWQPECDRRRGSEPTHPTPELSPGPNLRRVGYSLSGCDGFPAAIAAVMSEVQAGDGAHPNAAGDGEYAKLVQHWSAWKNWFQASDMP